MRTIIDFYLYHFKYHKSEWIAFLVNLLLLIVTIISEPPHVNLDSIDLGVVVICVYYAFNVIWSVKGLHGTFPDIWGKNETLDIWSTKCPVVLEPEFSPEDDEATKDRKIAELQINRIPDADRMLMQKRDIGVNLENADNFKCKIKKYILKHKSEVFKFFCVQYKKSKKANMFFNEKKLCYSGDILNDLKDGLMVCHDACYYDTFLTNVVAGKRLVKTENCGNGEIRVKQEILNGADYYPAYIHGGKYMLRDLPNSSMSNEIGVSTLAISADNKLIIWRQNPNTLSSPAMRVPSGSGSCDYNDYLKNQGSFIDTIEYAMNRELWEESGRKNGSLSFEQFAKTKLMGYFRWLNKGGKPEFVGVSKLSCKAYQLIADTKEMAEDDMVLCELAVDENNIETILDEFIADNSKEISIPLWACILRLREVLNDPELGDQIREFLFRRKTSDGVQ